MYGVDGSLIILGAASTDLSAANNKLTGATVTDNFPVAKITDGSNTLALAAGERTLSATFTIIPWDGSGTTIASAKSNIKLPDKLATVKIYGFGIAALDGSTNGIANDATFATWNYMGGGSITLTPEGYVQVTLPCERYGDTVATAAALT